MDLFTIMLVGFSCFSLGMTFVLFVQEIQKEVQRKREIERQRQRTEEELQRLKNEKRGY